MSGDKPASLFPTQLAGIALHWCWKLLEFGVSRLVIVWLEIMIWTPGGRALRDAGMGATLERAPSRGTRWRRSGLVLGLVLTLAPSAAAEQRLTWQDDWQRVGATEYAITGALGVGILTVMLWIPPAEEPSWKSPRLMDWSARDWLRIKTRSGREVAGTLSDTLVALSVFQPMVVDSLIVAGIADQNADVMHQTEVINLQAYAMTQFVNVTAKRVFARERPYVSACQTDPKSSDGCDDVDRYRSYYSGHSAISATSAGLVCAHHTHLKLYGGSPQDGIACGVAAGVTLVTGALRIAADRHWATDVITGYILGFAAGYLVPTLVYYGSFRREPEPPVESSQVMLRQSGRPTFAFSGTF